MKATTLNIRVSVEQKKEIEKFVKKETDFENISDFVRSLIRREMGKSKGSVKA